MDETDSLILSANQRASNRFEYTWAQDPNEEFHRNMFHRWEQQQQRHRWIDLSSRMEYFSICIYLWYKGQQWLRDWDDHQIDLLHWKYRLQHRKQRRDKDPSNYLYRGRIVRRHLELKWQFGSIGEPGPSGEDCPAGLEIFKLNLPRATLMKIRVPKNSPKMIFTASFILKIFVNIFSQSIILIFRILKKSSRFSIPDVFWVIVN